MFIDLIMEIIKIIILKSHLFSIVIILAMLISSCSNDKETIPDYIGTWTTTQSETVDGTIVNLKSTLTLSEGKYNDNIQVVAAPEVFMDLMKLFCDMTADDNQMHITIKRFGIIEVINDQPTGKMLYYDQNDPELEDLLSSSGISNPFTVQYSVVDNTLTIRSDVNKDGQINSSEITNYTRD